MIHVHSEELGGNDTLDPQNGVCPAPCADDDSGACAFRDTDAGSVTWCKAGVGSTGRLNAKVSTGRWCEQVSRLGREFDTCAPFLGASPSLFSPGPLRSFVQLRHVLRGKLSGARVRYLRSSPFLAAKLSFFPVQQIISNRRCDAAIDDGRRISPWTIS
jgi:hypothetical protein